MSKNFLIQKWLNNDLTAQEQKVFDTLEESDFLKEILEEGHRFKAQNSSKVGTYEKLKKKLPLKKNKEYRLPQIFARIAAVLIIGLSLLYYFENEKEIVFKTQRAQKEQITLPDASQVTLNELSQVHFNPETWDQKRSLQLRGEAYFEVAKGKRFDVHTEFGTVSVLGTEFNVIARNGTFSVTCFEGLVQLSHQKNTFLLPAGNAYRFQNGVGKSFSVAEIQPDWIQNLKVFEQKNIEVVFKAMEEHYKIKIVSESINSKLLFTGAFELDNLENALKEVTKTLDFTYEIMNPNIVIIRNAKK